MTAQWWILAGLMGAMVAGTFAVAVVAFGWWGIPVGLVAVRGLVESWTL